MPRQVARSHNETLDRVKAEAEAHSMETMKQECRKSVGCGQPDKSWDTVGSGAGSFETDSC
jgi:hypothetical protein